MIRSRRCSLHTHYSRLTTHYPLLTTHYLLRRCSRRRRLWRHRAWPSPQRWGRWPRLRRASKRCPPRLATPPHHPPLAPPASPTACPPPLATLLAALPSPPSLTGRRSPSPPPPVAQAEREVAEVSVLLIESQQRRLQWHREQPVPAHRRGEAAAANRIRAAERRLKSAELQAAIDRKP